MKRKITSILGVAMAAMLAGCAGQPQQFVVQQPDEQKPQTVTFPNGTTFGGASGTQASSPSQQALGMLEQLSQQQGTGEITLFFPTGSATLPSSGLQYDRLVNFLDYLSRDSRGRKVLFVMIGSASATGSMSINQKLSQERSQAPEPIINQYLVNVPHQFYKVYSLGDMYAPKNVTLQEDQRYQNVRIVAVYDTNQIPALQKGSGS